jgi:hypothetical protein
MHSSFQVSAELLFGILRVPQGSVVHCQAVVADKIDAVYHCNFLRVKHTA